LRGEAGKFAYAASFERSWELRLHEFVLGEEEGDLDGGIFVGVGAVDALRSIDPPKSFRDWLGPDWLGPGLETQPFSASCGSQ
jgi:hypothetical protein